jgi:hypothetical protein
MAFKEAARRASPVLLEPMMSVEVVTPGDYMGDVIGDLSSRRGKIQGMDQRGDAQVINAMVPLSEMFGYSDHAAVDVAGDAPCTPCTSRTTKRSPRARPKRSSRRSAAEAVRPVRGEMARGPGIQGSHHHPTRNGERGNQTNGQGQV